jgi:hypothetical protein
MNYHSKLKKEMGAALAERCADLPEFEYFVEVAQKESALVIVVAFRKNESLKEVSARLSLPVYLPELSLTINRLANTVHYYMIKGNTTNGSNRLDQGGASFGADGDDELPF